MDPIPSYNLLQSIDPTKVKVPISDRFAKLTLSSNKKKQQQKQQQEQQSDPEEQEELNRRHAKRDSVSRNISKQFQMEATEPQANIEVNPLLRSESSKDTERVSNELYGEELQKDQTMDPLQVSEDYENPTQIEEDLEILSQMVSGLVVNSAPISISSGSTDNLASTESQRSSTSVEDHLRIVRHIPINVKEALKQDTISLNLTNSTQNDEHDKTYEVTEDEVDSESIEEEEVAITISDTSESHDDEERNVMATSSLPSDSQTSGLLLPSLTDDKAERVAAFLRDVSIERRNMAEQGKLDTNDTVDQLIDNKEIDRIQETLNRSRKIATADTESMTPDVDEEEVTPKPVIERENRVKHFVSLVDNEMETKNKNVILNKEKDEVLIGNDDIRHNETLYNIEATNNAYGINEVKTPKNFANKTNVAHDETESNMDFSISELIETPKLQGKINMEALQDTKDNSRRLANIETEENTVHSITEYPLDTLKIYKVNKSHSLANEGILANSVISNGHEEISSVYNDNDPHRLANADTMTNSTLPGTEEVMSQAYDYTHDYKTPEKSYKTIKNSSRTIDSTPQTSKNKKTLHETIISLSSEHNDTTPEESIVISETDDENVEQKKDSPRLINSDDNNKLSNSFHNDENSSEDSDYDNDQMSQIQMSMGSINISAKINIKIRTHIQLNTSTESSDDDDDNNDKLQKFKNKSSNQKEGKITTNKTSKQLDIEEETSNKTGNLNQSSDNTSRSICNQVQLNVAKESVLNCSNISSNSAESVEDEEFLTEAERLLNQLYGKSWQTPDVIRNLKRSSKSNEKNANNSRISSKKKDDHIKSSNDPTTTNKSTIEESIIDDFSIFRRDIVKTNLDSTRFVTPKSSTEQRNKSLFTGSQSAKPLTYKTESEFAEKPPITKPFQTPSANIVTRRRVDNGRWRQLIDDDSNSEGDNASDDDDADESWSKNASEIEEDLSDPDFKSSPISKRRNKRMNTTKPLGGRNNKSNELAKRLNKSKEGELVYLDLSKEEVEVQEHVPESPPANHDATFASRLQDILKSCRHEDKAKLPSSSKTKTKRKLFTPIFGNDDLEGLVLDKEEEQIKVDIAKPISQNEEDILEDYDNCPFDSQGRPKVFDLINKPLESVKTGKPIFQITPPKTNVKAAPLSHKNDKNIKACADSSTKCSGSTTKSNRDDELFKTPLTIKSKQPAKSMRNLTKTPEYKYSFLKSLDVTVSKSFCHPDALYYRDNYRTKKEDLSKILYEIYNERLFENKLNVPITWNKKLSNTAGRCLNKKKLGIRSSVIELSEKVLTSGDRLRCTLIHELCHAATWIFDGEGGHGSTWKLWARKANAVFPEIPKIGVCHQYDIEYKYTYKCTLCSAKSHAHSKSKKVENIRCSYCHGAIEIFLNKKDKDGNIMPTPVKEPTGFAKFVKDNYKKFKRDDLKHADVMKLLSNEFALLKVTAN